MYRTICTEFWTDPDIKPLDGSTKLLFLYLITNPHTHLSGIYYLPLELLLKETGLKLIPYRYGIDTLSKMKKAYRDDLTETIFVTNMFQYQGRGTKNFIAAADQLETLHNSCLIPLFLVRYPHIPYRYPIDTVSNISPSVPVPVSDSDSSPNPDLSEELSDSEKTTESNKDEFAQFWNCYPLKVGKKDARKMWAKAKDRPTIDVILSAIHRAMQTEKWRKNNGEFIPNPATWINQGRWEDEGLKKPMTTTEAFLLRGEATR